MSREQDRERQVRSRRRANKLAKRGEAIEWSREHNCWVWVMRPAAAMSEGQEG